MTCVPGGAERADSVRAGLAAADAALTDAGHAAGSGARHVLVHDAARAFIAAGFNVERNTPFAGAYVPVDYDKDTAVLAVMIEVRKDLLESDESRVRVEAALAEVIRKAVEISRTDMGRPL